MSGNTAADTLRAAWQEAAAKAHDFLAGINQKVSEGSVASPEELAQGKELASAAAKAKTDYEAQRDLEALVSDNTPDAETMREIADLNARVGEENESKRKAVRDNFGHDELQDFDNRAARQLEAFGKMCSEGRSGGVTLDLNVQAARNYRELTALGLSGADYVAAVRSGSMLMAENGSVRAYNIATSGQGQELVPTFWEDTLYLPQSYIGGVQAAGAQVIPVMGNNQVRVPKVTAYASGLGIVNESTAPGETRDTTDTTDLTPRPFKGYTALTREIMQSTPLDVQMLLAMRALGRALQLGKEDAFHIGTGANQPQGVIGGNVGTARTHKTGAVDRGVRFSDNTAALALLDAGYHMDTTTGGITLLVHSAVWFTDYVGLTANNGHPIFPSLSAGGSSVFGARRVYSHRLAQTPADGAFLAIYGNFYDAYVIATTGTASIDISDEARFSEFERAFRIVEDCDGRVQDRNALAYIRSQA